MSGFVRKSISKQEEKLAYLEVKDLALNASNEVIGHGSSASVYKILLRGKFAAAKQFHVHLNKNSILKAASTLIELRHKNVCRLRGYRTVHQYFYSSIVQWRLMVKFYTI